MSQSLIIQSVVIHSVRRSFSGRLFSRPVIRVGHLVVRLVGRLEGESVNHLVGYWNMLFLP